MAILKEIRFHGRGGQGVVTAANLLAMSYFNVGKYVQSFPIFGTERRGAPVASFVRVDDKPIRIRTQIYEPDVVVVLDSGVAEVVDVTKGLKKNGVIIMNTKKNPDEIKLGNRVATIDATNIAIKHRLGSTQAPIVNTAILGAYTKAVEQFGLEKLSLSSVVNTVRENVPAKPEENAAAVKEAYESTVF